MHLQNLQKTKSSIVGLLTGNISFVFFKGPEYTTASPPSPSYAFVAGSDPVTVSRPLSLRNTRTLQRMHGGMAGWLKALGC